MRINHVAIAGGTGSGKSFLQAQIGSEASKESNTFFVDTSRTFAGIKRMSDTHRFILFDHLRINPWDEIEGVPTNLSDAVINQLIAHHCGLQYGLYELCEATEHIRKEFKDSLNIVSLISYLEQKRYPPGSRRAYYRDSAVLGLKHILSTSGDGSIYRCKRGMSIKELLEGNTVLLCNGTPESQSFIVQLIVTIVELLVYSGVRLSRQLLLFLDEMQLLFRSERNRLLAFPLACRHIGIHLVMSFQNLSACPPELLTNADAFFCFRTVDDRDRQVFRRMTKMSDDQSWMIASLETGECISYIPNSDINHAFRAKTPKLEVIKVDSQKVADESNRFASRFKWTPIELSSAPTGEVSTDKSGVAKTVDAFMADVLDQRHEYSAAMQRWERAGARSRDIQTAVLSKCFSEGLIVEDRLPLNLSGPSIVLYAPSEKTFKKYGVQWKPSGRGLLKTRAASFYLFKSLSQVEGIKSIVEGNLNGKQVDILVRRADGSAITLEIAGATGKHECHNALHCLSCAEVERHVIVCLGSKVVTDVKRRIRAHEELKKDARLRIVLLCHAVNGIDELIR